MESLMVRFYKEVFLPYCDLLKAEYKIHSSFNYVKKMWEEKLTMDELVNGPYLEKSQLYKEGEKFENLPLQDKTKETIRNRLNGRGLWKHQTDAVRLILDCKNTVIATGTSSGKTLCYQIPILNDLIEDSSPGLRAIIIYPLNALVNDQMTEWEEMLAKHPQITFARFTGQTPDNEREYVNNIQHAREKQLEDSGLSKHEAQKNIMRYKEESKVRAIPNRLDHRESIRDKPPHILITNFSMLEYLLERPIDAPIFENARLKFIVLDEVHAYRGVQATEIAFLIRRLKDRLNIEKLVSIATSATLGKQGDQDSQKKVCQFASDLFGEPFLEPNPIYGVTADPSLKQPSIFPTPDQYLKVAELLQNNSDKEMPDIRQNIGINIPNKDIDSILAYDGNLYRLRKEILNKPILLKGAAEKLWPNTIKSIDGLYALIEIVAKAKTNQSNEDLLPTRLHYFVKAQDGLHVCLNKACPGRLNEKPPYFLSRKNNVETPEGDCPHCYKSEACSKLVEVVTCKKCGYLYGALQDLGPRRAQNLDNSDQEKPYFDSFSTELGWAADSYWSYFSVEDDLPYPSQDSQNEDDEDNDQNNLISKPYQLPWCVFCGKKADKAAGDNCKCERPSLRIIQIFHRQCPHFGKAKDRDNLLRPEKSLLSICPNCHVKTTFGEPVHRFQESDDEMGLAMAIPLAHFQVSPMSGNNNRVRKLLCFTDHRQRAAAFPSLLEEETFPHDMGRKILEILDNEDEPIDLVSLGGYLADAAEPKSETYDPEFFLPVSQYPNDSSDAKSKRNTWLAEVFAYFGIPDSARESVEDFGLVSVVYRIDSREKEKFHTLFASQSDISIDESYSVLQTLLTYMRHRKAFTLPKSILPDEPAFGRVSADISYNLEYEGERNTNGWLPNNKTKPNVITDYLCRVFKISHEKSRILAENIWNFLTNENILQLYKNNSKKWKLDHERLFVKKASSRYVCSRCSIITTYSFKGFCPQKGCNGSLNPQLFNPEQENIIARWVSGDCDLKFTTLKSEEHTAQINKGLAKIIEDQFRSEDGGVNLLSSTTTFEMGINIGDLQKVLLRNAPPSSANYIQRVGRAGRGKDKNSICVTLCRRTKYDADIWKNPPRLMSGEVRTPTVFIKNYVIAQRHFNAVLFAKFLREKIVTEKKLEIIKQTTRFELFLPVDIRVNNIPENWLKSQPKDLFFNFLGWLNEQSSTNIFQTKAVSDLLDAIGGFEKGKNKAKDKYSYILSNIEEELSALLVERKTLVDKGNDYGVVEIGKAIQSILDIDIIILLAKREFLPRYAFPLDVVTLETGKTRWSSQDTEVTLSRDRGIAIAEFAPNSQVIAHKKVFTSAGLYVISKKDMPEQEWYSECPNCKQIRTSKVENNLKGNCSVCQKEITSQYIRSFITPTAFSIRIEKDNKQSVRYRRSTLIRQRQTLTHFIDQIEESSFCDFNNFRLALKESGNLFRYNLGPEKKGFILCPECGWSESLCSYKAGKKHQRLRSIGGVMECNNINLRKPLAYGHEFQSFCLIVRPIKPIGSVESLAYALQQGLCKSLHIEPSDIGVSWRRLSGKNPNQEIIFYDITPGGAGFVKEAFECWANVVQFANDLCRSCSCEAACYDCIKHYSNQAYHEKLDRHNVIQFLLS